MKILAVLPLYPPRSRVGAWLTTHEYLAALAARGHRVDVLVLMSSQADYDLDGVHVHPRNWTDYQPDIVVSHLGDRHEGARYAEKAGLPSVRMVHGYDPQNAEKLDQVPTDLAVFPSRALANETGWPGHQIIAHPPVFAERYQTHPGHHVTLCNLMAEKGGELFGYIAASLHDVPFLGVKGGWGRQVLRLPPNVEVVPVVEDMRLVYKRTRILLMPSERESYGRVAVEAACSGIPTIAHPSPGLQEAMGDNAIWIDRSDLNGWVSAIRRLRNDDRWREASERALQHSRWLTPVETTARVADSIESLVRVTASP